MAHIYSGVNSQHRDPIDHLEDGWVVYISDDQVQILIIIVEVE
jgi:hypothetical protein